jgi:transcriptional regulator with XRE-family HTH domain
MDAILSIAELEARLGEDIKTLRLKKNIDRQSLCEQAGVSLNALKHLESGQGAAIKTLIRVIRALGREEWLLGVAPQISINPMQMVRNRPMRQRASKKHDDK